MPSPCFGLPITSSNAIIEYRIRAVLSNARYDGDSQYEDACLTSLLDRTNIV
jgi:hypothetical protein